MLGSRFILCCIAASSLALTAMACGEDAATREEQARAAQRELGYEVQWVGRSFAGLQLTDVSRSPNGVGLIYGDCTAKDDTGCSPPLEIQVSSICGRNALLLDIRPNRTIATRGVRVFDYEENVNLELATGESDVVVFADKPALARRAVAALRPVGSVRRAKLAPPRYPRYYLAELRRVRDAYARTRSVRAVRDKLGISQSQVRFVLSLAREVGTKRLRAADRGGRTLRAMKRELTASRGKARRVDCPLEPAPR